MYTTQEKIEVMKMAIELSKTNTGLSKEANKDKALEIFTELMDAITDYTSKIYRKED